jgi:AmiR/NasT family two-component response regulator
LESAGLDVRGETNCSNILQDTIKKTPDVIVCFQDALDAPFLDGLAAVAASAARPVVVFTLDPDAEKMAAATGSGAHAYVVAGYQRNRLRAIVQLAQARFAHEQRLRQELADVRKRFEERKLVDRAKGILMGARQLREEEAFRALRSAAMASKRRIGQVSQVVIDSAHYAEAVNQAGQLRMLSQRLVKFQALACAGVTDNETQDLLAAAIAQVDANLASLDRNLSKATFGDLLGMVQTPWAKLRASLRLPPTVARLRDIDSLAEQLLERAETLTANLEVAAFATALHAINVAGRQRMLTQRLAKEIFLGTLAGAPRPRAVKNPLDGATSAEFLRGWAYLDSLPLSNTDITRELAAAREAWREFQEGVADRFSPAGRARIARSSETLLHHFDRVTESIERGVHALVGV